MIKLVTLDLDNTLWDADPIIDSAHRAMVTWLVEHIPGCEPQLDDTNWRGLRARLIQERPDIAHHPTHIRKAMLRQVLAPLALDPSARETAIETAFSVFHDRRNLVEPYPEAIALLEYLQARVAVVAVTNGNSDLKRIGLAPYFTHIVSAESAGVAKPHPGIFLTALQLAGDVPPERALHVGDHLEEDIEAARRLGFKTVWVNPARSEKPQHCHPDGIAHSAAELLQIMKTWVPETPSRTS